MDVFFCPVCGSRNVVKNGHDSSHSEKHNYNCRDCNRYFDDLANTIFERHHHPLEAWIACLYLMGVNLSNRQIAKELGLAVSDVQSMTTLLGDGIAEKHHPEKLSGEVECDEVYIVAGHKGYHEAVDDSGREPRRNRLKGAPGRGTLAQDKPPILGMIQRNGSVVVHMLPNVKKETIEPILRSTIEDGSMVYTDEYTMT